MTRLPPRGPRAAAWRRGVIVAACVALAACAAEAIAPGHPRMVHALALTPYDIHEECVRLAVADRLEYDFSASEPVDFAIRYRDGAAVLAPFARAGVRVDSGIFVPQLALDYCLVWETGPAGALLDYRVRLRPAAR